MSNPTNMRFGILGTGRITRRLVADLQSVSEVSVTAIASRTQDRAAWYADSYGIPHGVHGYQDLIDRDDVDAVYVALPPSLHHEWTLACLEAGNHVLCEKPLTTTLAHSVELVERANEKSLRLMDATAWLHHERTDAIESWLPRTAGAADVQPEFGIGELRHISAAVSFTNPFQSGDHRMDAGLGGGCLLDLGWYAASLIQFATGELPASVWAESNQQNGVAHRVTAMMRFPSGVSATLSCAFDTATRKWFEIAGSSASIVCDDFTRPWQPQADDPPMPARCWVREPFGKVHRKSFECHQERRMIRRFAGDTDRQPFQRHSLNTQAIVQAVERSIVERGPVELEKAR
ncbi:MAG: Gfo/Idh/MocA family oxidoreductase [Planctomycetota bacterium]